MANNLVSIIIPVFNAYRWKKSILISMTNNIEYIKEIILINDGDINNFIKLSNFLKKKLPNSLLVFLFNKKNIGPGPSRNLGLDIARGEFVLFFDCDDILMQGFLKKSINLLIQNKNIFFSYSNWCFFKNSDGPFFKLPNEAYIHQIIITQFLALPSMVFRKNLILHKFENIGHEDYLFYLNNMQNGLSYGMNTNANLVKIRKTPGSYSSNKFKTITWQWNILKKFKISFFLKIMLFIAYVINALGKRYFRLLSPNFFSLDKKTKDIFLNK